MEPFVVSGSFPTSAQILIVAYNQHVLLVSNIGRAELCQFYLTKIWHKLDTFIKYSIENVTNCLALLGV